MEAAPLWTEIRKYEAILAKDPGAYSFAPLADLYRRLGLLDDALAIAERGVHAHPAFAAGQMVLARIQLDRGVKDEARRALQQAVRVTPENLEAQLLLAGLLGDSGATDEAEACLQTLLTLAPDHGEAKSLLVALRSPGAPVEPAVLPAVTAFDLDDGDEDELLEVEEILEADLLEVDEDLTGEDDSFKVFAAAPERPSLQALAPARPAAAPPVLPREESVPEDGDADWQVTEEFGLESGQSGAPQAVASPTIAELYLEQGFPDKAIAVYKELLAADPGNGILQGRLSQLLGEAAAPSPAEMEPLAAPAADSAGIIARLEGWLANIGRVRACRSENR
jgi:tetratricopeptide (TPR) repeat protein